MIGIKNLLLGLVLLAAAVWASLRRTRAVAFGAGWFVICLLPVANIIPIPTMMAETAAYRMPRLAIILTSRKR